MYISFFIKNKCTRKRCMPLQKKTGRKRLRKKLLKTFLSRHFALLPMKWGLSYYARIRRVRFPISGLQLVRECSLQWGQDPLASFLTCIAQELTEVDHLLWIKYVLSSTANLEYLRLNVHFSSQAITESNQC